MMIIIGIEYLYFHTFLVHAAIFSEYFCDDYYLIILLFWLIWRYFIAFLLVAAFSKKRHYRYFFLYYLRLRLAACQMPNTLYFDKMPTRSLPLSIISQLSLLLLICCLCTSTILFGAAITASPSPLCSHAEYKDDLYTTFMRANAASACVATSTIHMVSITTTIDDIDTHFFISRKMPLLDFTYWAWYYWWYQLWLT